jgi:hypothetical protein
MSGDPLSSSAQSRVRTLLAERARPLLLVVASPGAEALARKAGLTAADLVRPFCSLRGVAVPFRCCDCECRLLSCSYLFESRYLYFIGFGL